MGFIKIIKSKAYYKRFQVKFRRRREGKTDYRQRKRLVAQDKNKYNTPKYRFVVRFSNKDITCQIAYAKIVGDVIISAAYGHELVHFGMPAGQNNFAAAYATGLLLARRTLKKLGLADRYKGNENVNGEDFNVEELPDGPRPFSALLDVGLRRTTTGAKVFAALKGATDGGISIPHSETRFVGYDKEAKKLNADVLRKYIFGGNVADYMKYLKDNNSTKYEKHFSKYIKAGLKPDDLEKTWQKVHKAIRTDPTVKRPTKERPKVQKRFNKLKMSRAQRKDRVRQKKEAKARKQQQE
jgi:large subunit ribosomal protein L5e